MGTGSIATILESTTHFLEALGLPSLAVSKLALLRTLGLQRGSFGMRIRDSLINQGSESSPVAYTLHLCLWALRGYRALPW